VAGRRLQLEASRNLRAVTRYSNPELDTVLDQMEQMQPSPEDAAYLDLVKQATEIFVRDLPEIPLFEETQTLAFNTTYWTGWPSAAARTWRRSSRGKALPVCWRSCSPRSNVVTAGGGLSRRLLSLSLRTGEIQHGQDQGNPRVLHPQRDGRGALP
jgi:hypothetical protein